MASSLPKTAQMLISGPVPAAPELDALQGLIEVFVATTLETLSAADATCPSLRGDPDHRARVDEILARIGEVEALMALVRTLGWPDGKTVAAGGHAADRTGV